MPDKSIVIVGAGLAGLSTGCYAQMNGYKTQIFEMQNKPGGVCVAWQRRAYAFDYAVHNVFGISTKPTGSLYNKIWDELKALRDTSAYAFKEFVQVEADNKVFTVYSDVDELERHLKSLSPSDQKVIDEFTGAIRKFSGKDLDAAMLGGIGEKLKMLPLMSTLIKFSKINLKEYAEKFSDPFLRKAFATIQYDLDEIPVIIPIIFLSMLNIGDCSWPIGGSAALSKNIEKTYLELGGQVHYYSKVEKIIVKDNTAVGVQTQNGKEHHSDLVISAADGYSTIFGMLQGNYVTQFIKSYYESFPKAQPFGLELWYGVNRTFSGEPHALVLFLDEPFTVENILRDKLDVEILNFDPSLAPSGKTVVKVNLNSEYDYWKPLSANKEQYQAKKQQISKVIAEKLEKRFPGFTSQIEATDVVTPISVEHWTGGYRGFAQPWPPPPTLAKEINKNGVSKTLPGLSNFYMVGQWAGGTFGISTVCMMGRQLVSEICKKDHRKFHTKGDN